MRGGGRGSAAAAAHPCGRESRAEHSPSREDRGAQGACAEVWPGRAVAPTRWVTARPWSRDPKALGRGSGSKDGGSGMWPVPPAAPLEELSTCPQRGDTAADGKQQQTRTSTSAPRPELRTASAQKPVPREEPARTTEQPTDSPAGSERAGCRARGVDCSSGAESPGLLCSLHCRCVDQK